MPTGDYWRGRYRDKTLRVLRLLRGDLAMTEIARIVGLSNQRVSAVNKQFKVRKKREAV